MLLYIDNQCYIPSDVPWIVSTDALVCDISRTPIQAPCSTYIYIQMIITQSHEQKIVYKQQQHACRRRAAHLSAPGHGSGDPQSHRAPRHVFRPQPAPQRPAATGCKDSRLVKRINSQTFAGQSPCICRRVRVQRRLLTERPRWPRQGRRYPWQPRRRRG